MTNYKIKKAGGNPRIALWPGKPRKKPKCFFSTLFYYSGNNLPLLMTQYFLLQECLVHISPYLL